ncbi:MAG: tetratricopeptide repeat protein [Verrucomicrobia bacterium]|nr:tetratricopeptide repeat protein [Verrucomicrobiota bacterium]
MNPPRALSVTRQLLSRRFLVFFSFAMGAGLWVGPLPVCAALPNRGLAAESRSTPQTPSAQRSDLALTKEGDRKAKALAAFSEGLLAEEDGDKDRAFEAYRRSLAADSDNTELAAKVAFELAERGEIAEGIDLLKDAAKAAPKEMLPPLCLSQIYAKFLKKPALAIKNAALALELDPESIEPYLALVELYTAEGQTKKAGAILDRALKSESTDGDFWCELAELCARLDLSPEGTASPGKIQRLNTLFQKSLTLDPENLENTGKAADFYFQTKQFEPAVPLFRKLIAAEEEPGSEDALALQDKLARALMETKHRDQALEVLQAMAEAAPQRVETHALIGDLHLLDGHLKEALASYREVIQLDPSIAPAHLRVADLEMRLGQREEALSTLTEARKKFPGTALITYSLAATLAQAGRFAQALVAFEETLREAPASKPTLPNASFYLAYGMAAEQSGDVERASTLLKKSIELAPNNSAQARNYLGYMWLDRGLHLPEAGALIQRAVKEDPKNGAYLDSLGWYFYKIADYPQAIASLLKALAALPRPDPVVFEHLGDSYAASGETAKALEAWNRALALDPENKALPGKIQSAQRKPLPVAKP